ncbi:MAG: sterol desaturase family protein [Halioglobus sp.]
MDIQTKFTIYLVCTWLLAMAAELIAGTIQGSARPKRDLLFTTVSFFTQPIVTGVVIASLAALGMGALFPKYQGALSELPVFPVFVVIFLTNEFCHYWVHRFAHEKRWMWKLHRTHHSGMNMNATLIFRYNLFWPILLPQSWMGAIVLYLGQVEAFYYAVWITFTVNLLTHMSFRWDLTFRQRFPATEPFWRILERIITLPDAHQAHHAYGAEQAHPNGNYAVTLFFYDILFGTAKLPVMRQEKFGLPISPRLPWAEELLWPVIRQPLLPKATKVE